MISRLCWQSCKRLSRDTILGLAAANHTTPSIAWAIFKQRPIQAIYSNIKRLSTKKVHRYSWAAERLMQLGEEVILPEKRELIEVTPEMLQNPPEKIQKMAEDIIDLNLLEINQLIGLIQRRLQISDEMVAAALSGGGAGEAAGGAAEPVAEEKPKEKDAFTLRISAPVDQKVKIKVIKEVRTITGLGLKEAKELVEKAPVVLKEGVKKEEAEAFKKLLTDSGAQVELV